MCDTYVDEMVCVCACACVCVCTCVCVTRTLMRWSWRLLGSREVKNMLLCPIIDPTGHMSCVKRDVNVWKETHTWDLKMQRETTYSNVAHYRSDHLQALTDKFCMARGTRAFVYLGRHTQCNLYRRHTQCNLYQPFSREFASDFPFLRISWHGFFGNILALWHWKTPIKPIACNFWACTHCWVVNGKYTSNIEWFRVYFQVTTQECVQAQTLQGIGWIGVF